MCTSPLYRIIDEKFEYVRSRSFGCSQVVGRETYKYLKERLFIPDSYFERIPCGSCTECRLRYSKEWALRCVLESKLYPDNYCWFVTLTYDDFHLPEPILIFDGKTGDSLHFYPLVRKDIQVFLKRLRKRFSGLRVYYAGEYGDKSLRPHFHMILFNVPLLDLIENSEFSRSKISEIDSNRLFESKIINDCWSDCNHVLKGFCAVAPFSYETAAYTARYCMKKLKGEAFKEFENRFICSDIDTGEIISFPREFVGMSLKPGIGAGYFEEKWNSIYSCDKVVSYYKKQVNRDTPPRYFDVLAERKGVNLEEIKKIRKELAEIFLAQKLETSGYTEDVYLSIQKEIVKNRSKRLIRDL